MKVTAAMIHKELRFRGLLIRLLIRFHSKRSFLRAYSMAKKHSCRKLPHDLSVEEQHIPRPDGSLLRVLVCYPIEKKDNATGVLWLHGGGYAIGLQEEEFTYVRHITRETNTVMVLPDYRVSLEAPYPAALEDAYTALLWLKASAAQLGVNPHQLFVAGESAGGGLTAAVTAYARDQGDVQVAFQMPLYPMLDDRMTTPSAIDNNAPVWDAQANKLAWQLYLGPLCSTDQVPPYAAPTRLTDFSRLPPTYTFVGDIEPFYDETVQYINQLKNAGVQADIDIYKGCFHAFDLMGADTRVGQQATGTWLRHFKFACEHYFAMQNDFEPQQVP